MYDPHSPHGRTSWDTPWPLGILLDLRESIGGLQAGQRIVLDNQREIFGQLDEIRDDVTTLKTAPRPIPHPSPEASPPRPGLIPALTDLARALRDLGLRELAAWAALMAIALKGALTPEAVAAWLDALK